MYLSRCVVLVALFRPLFHRHCGWFGACYLPAHFTVRLPTYDFGLQVCCLLRFTHACTLWLSHTIRLRRARLFCAVCCAPHVRGSRCLRLTAVPHRCDSCCNRLRVRSGAVASTLPRRLLPAVLPFSTFVRDRFRVSTTGYGLPLDGQCLSAAPLRTSRRLRAALAATARRACTYGCAPFLYGGAPLRHLRRTGCSGSAVPVWFYRSPDLLHPAWFPSPAVIAIFSRCAPPRTACAGYLHRLRVTFTGSHLLRTACCCCRFYHYTGHRIVVLLGSGRVVHTLRFASFTLAHAHLILVGFVVLGSGSPRVYGCMHITGFCRCAFRCFRIRLFAAVHL